MRNGVLITEESPLTLLEVNNASMLEDVVLKYCLQEDMPHITEVASNFKTDEKFDPTMYRQDENTKSSETNAMHRIRALTVKNLIVLMRNIG